ncbi:hypothetical protein C0991_006998 [Blastosporella zonata]|nr:hypothetical protein C0991_006998 [Blastosporella zonata]
MMKAIDIRSESAVKLLAEFLDIDAPYTEGGRHTNAEHFAHEVYSYVRSPFRDLFVYDTAIQYDFVNEAPPPEQRGHGPGTSRRPGPSVKGKGRADPSCATPVDVDESGPIALPVSEAGSSSVAQSSNQVESPAPPSWPSRARPLRFGHRSLLQSVQTHLKQGVDNQMSGFKGKPERHHDSSMTHDSTSSTPPALLARLSDVTPTSGAQLADRGSELGASTRSQSTAIPHRDLPPKGTTLPSPSREVHSAEIMPQSRTKVALEPRSIPETKSDKLPSPSPSSSIHDRQTPQASRPSQIHGMPENIRILGAAKGQANLTTSTLSPPTPSLSILDRATTTTTTATTSLPISSSSEKLSQHDVAPGIQHMGISLHDSSFDHHEPRPLISAHANDDQSHQSSRKELLARLEREKLQACAEELGSDRTSRMSDVDRHAMSTFEPEQVPGSTVVDPHVIEAKLRTRAQLQVRLAAERSSLVSHVVSLLH